MRKLLMLCLIAVLVTPLCSVASEVQTINANHGITIQLPTWMKVQDSNTAAALEKIAQDSAASQGMASATGRHIVLNASGRDMIVRLVVTTPTPATQAEINAFKPNEILQLGKQLESQIRQGGTGLIGGVSAYTSNKIANRRSFIYEYQRSTLLGTSAPPKRVVVYQLVSGNNLVEMTVSFPASDRAALAVLGNIQKSLRLP